MTGDNRMTDDKQEQGGTWGGIVALDPDPKTFDKPALPGMPSTCEKLGAPEATQYYKWGLPVTGFSSATNYDKGMCLAEVS